MVAPGGCAVNGAADGLPILLMGAPRVEERARLGGGGGTARRPERGRQIERISPRFEILQTAFAARRAEVQLGMGGAEPEQVIVLETIGTIEDFIRAVQRIDGLEFLGEFDEEDVPPDEDFFIESDPDKALSGTIYLVMASQQAIEQLLGLWARFRDEPDEPFERGLGRFRRLFELLRDIRSWGPTDRLESTGVLEDWQERVDARLEVVPVEIELWFRDDEQDRLLAQAEVTASIANAGGQSVTSAIVPEIRYHAVLARLPIGTVETLLQTVDGVELVRSDRVMFLRPVGQGVVALGAAEGLPLVDRPGRPEDTSDPIVGLLDGVPLEQHELLSGRLVVDDPDDLASMAPAHTRRHGTAMASLILHGDLTGRTEALGRRLYVRPLLAPGPAWVGNAPETIPEDQLAVDLTLRAVRRMFEGEAEVEAVAPTVRIVNMSIGDNAPFAQTMSPWARMLDWVSWKYQILVVVSAGNHWTNIELSVDPATYLGLTEAELELATLVSLANEFGSRRLLPPSEAINVLTVGSANRDESVVARADEARELITSNTMPAPYSALGMGFRRSIKPDILVPGGRAVYDLSPHGAGVTATPVATPTSPPGQLVASPLGPPGTRSGTTYSAGTSNAAAVASHSAAVLYDVLGSLRDEAGADFLLDRGVMTSALKALIVHGASLGDALLTVTKAFTGRVEPRKLREFVTRFVGYGALSGSAVQGSSGTRATMLGGGLLGTDEAHVYDIPLPPGLSGKTGQRRLTMTLSWLTPTNSRDRRYRRARLWLSSPVSELNVDRTEADWRASQRGTVQHEILEGTRAAAYDDGHALTVKVNCTAHAGLLDVDVPYALAISIEVAPELDVDVFAEIRDRIRPPVEVRPAG